MGTCVEPQNLDDIATIWPMGFGKIFRRKLWALVIKLKVLAEIFRFLSLNF